MRGIAKAKLLGAMALIGLLSLAIAGAAAAELPGENSPLLPNTGNIRGTITDEGGAPIEHIEVCGMTESTNPTGLRYCTRTEEGGQYLIYDVPEGNFLVNAQAPWYLGEEPMGKENYPQVWYVGARHPAEATPVPVTGEHTTTGIDFQVHQGGEITGRVTDKVTGDPIASVEVCPTWAGIPQRGEEHSCGLTDAAGHYTIKNVDTDEYTITFDTHLIHGYAGASYPTDGSTPVAVPVVAGQVTAGIDGQLTPERTSGAGAPPSPSGPGDTTGSRSAGGSQPETSPPALPPVAHPRLNCRHGRQKVSRRGRVRCVRVKQVGSKYHADRR